MMPEVRLPMSIIQAISCVCKMLFSIFSPLQYSATEACGNLDDNLFPTRKAKVWKTNGDRLLLGRLEFDGVLRVLNLHLNSL